ncbi:MAG: hypothetical protein RSC82_01895 [Oscillospiraceae bacterium]
MVILLIFAFDLLYAVTCKIASILVQNPVNMNFSILAHSYCGLEMSKKRGLQIGAHAISSYVRLAAAAASAVIVTTAAATLVATTAATAAVAATEQISAAAAAVKND